MHNRSFTGIFDVNVVVPDPDRHPVPDKNPPHHPTHTSDQIHCIMHDVLRPLVRSTPFKGVDLAALELGAKNTKSDMLLYSN